MRINSLLFIFFVLFFYGIFSAHGQTERRLSLHAQGGLAIYPTNQFIQSDGLADRVFAGFRPGFFVGAGANYRIWKGLHLTETYSFQKSSKEHFNLSVANFRTGLRYNFISQKRFKPFVGVNHNFSYVNLKRGEYSDSIAPNSDNVIGPGIIVSKIVYNFDYLDLKNLLMSGFGATAGFEYKFKKFRNKLSVFGEYGIQANVTKRNDAFEKDYGYINYKYFIYHTASVGVRFHMYRPEKQLLAKITRDEWRNDKPVDIKGTLVYKNNKRLYDKVLELELDDTLQNKISVLQSDDKGLIFLAKDVQIGDYKFMFAKRKKRIVRADLQILNYNRIEIADEELELEMVETEISENLLSRDGNFSVLLREGFQHEIMLSTTAENIMGTLALADPKCRLRIYLKDLKDSVISYIDTLTEDKSFNFVNITPGKYKLQFVRMDDNCKETDFDYKFTGSMPFVSKQSNADEPEDTTPVYNIAGKVLSDKKSGVQKGTVVKLIGNDGKVESSVPVEAKGEYSFDKLNNTGYRVYYEDPSEKARLSYSIRDRKAHDLHNVNYGSSKRPGSGPVMVKGKVITTKAEDATKITVLLVDSTGKIRKRSPLAADGTFAFNELAKNKYKVVYESTDPFLRGNLRYRVEDPTLKITKVVLPDMKATAEITDTIHVTKQEDVIVDTVPAPSNDKRLVRKKEPVPMVAYKNFKPNTTYTIDGVEVKPTGYGMQVASFFVYTNLESFCKRLRDKGEKNVYIQVLIKDKNNPQLGNIYRVMIGDNDDKDKVVKDIPKYIDKGYDPVLRKHLQ